MKGVLSAEQMVASDQYTIQQLGVPGVELMERAAQACIEALTPHLTSQSNIAVITGAGNNGGDGFAIARLLLEAGYAANTIMLFEPEKLQGDALANYQNLKERTDSIVLCGDNLEIDTHVEWIVDAIFGTGLNRPAQGRIADAIETINQHPSRVLAVDLPSGLFGSKSVKPGPAVKADITLSFQALKTAHCITPACLSCGQIIVPDIGIRIPGSIEINTFFLNSEDYERPSRDPNSHKGSHGTLAILGGFEGMEGAANLCAVASLRFGAGKTKVYTNAAFGRFHHDSVMVANIDQLQNDHHQHWVLGPGLSRIDNAGTTLKKLSLSQARVVWDADSLYFLSQERPYHMGKDWVITPHPGEAGMLLGVNAAEVQRDRLAAIHALGETYPGGWILLKGHRSLILSPNGELFICGPGGPALATAGSGDVLSGMIGAMFAQGFPTDEAILLACLRHGIAGERWSRHHRDYAMLAEDIIEDLKS